jgi:hypothetical protein
MGRRARPSSERLTRHRRRVQGIASRRRCRWCLGAGRFRDRTTLRSRKSPLLVRRCVAQTEPVGGVTHARILSRVTDAYCPNRVPTARWTASTERQGARSADRCRRRMVPSAGVDRVGDIAAPARERSFCVLDDDPSTSAEAPIWRYHHGATARRSGADDLCSPSGAFRMSGSARSA